MEGGGWAEAGEQGELIDIHFENTQQHSAKMKRAEQDITA